MAYNINKSFKNELPLLPKIYIYLRINRLEKILRKIIFIFNINIKKKILQLMKKNHLMKS